MINISEEAFEIFFNLPELKARLRFMKAVFHLGIEFSSVLEELKVPFQLHN
jgi:hypothetical protein